MINQSITMNTKKSLRQDDTRFFTEVHLLADKLVPVVAIHSLGGSRANGHHTPNPQPGAAQPTQDEDPQATHNLLELPLALRQEGTRTPHNHNDRSQRQSPSSARRSTNHRVI